jgi:hypothetical protein
MRFVLVALLIAACTRVPMNAPRYAADIFSEDTIPVPVTVRVTGPMQVSLNGAGFYQYRGQPVVITPAALVVRGTGTAIIAAVDSSKPIALVPSGTPLDSIDRTAIVARMLKLTRAEGSSDYRIEIHRP